MHPQAVKEIVALCRRRSRQGDCPTEQLPSPETLEDTIIALARMLDVALAPDGECEAGVLHWEAPNG